MTVIEAEAPKVEAENEGEATVTESNKRGRNPDRDFSKVADRHKALADFINNHEAFKAAGLDPITPNTVKAVQLLADDYRNTPEQAAARKEREEARKAEESEFAGLSDDEKKELRSANRKAKALAEVEERRAQLLEKARQIRESAEASGEDLAAASNAEASSGQQEPGKRRIGARK